MFRTCLGGFWAILGGVVKALGPCLEVNKTIQTPLHAYTNITICLKVYIFSLFEGLSYSLIFHV